MKKLIPWWALIVSGFGLQMLANAVSQSIQQGNDSSVVFWIYYGLSILGGLLILFGIARGIIGLFRKRQNKPDQNQANE